MKSNKRTTDLTQGPIGRTLLMFFLPIAAGNLFQQFYNTADAFIIARFVGRNALAAVGGSSAQVINVLIGFFTALSGGAGVVIAQTYGSGDKERVSLAAHTAIVMSAVLGCVFSVIGFAVCPQILASMNTPEDTMAGSILYLRIWFCGMVFNMLYNTGAAILRAMGDSRRPLYVLTVCCLTNIGLDILFVAVFRMGVAGVALATILSQFISAMIVLYFLVTSPEAYRIELRRLRTDMPSLRRMLHIGIPAGLQSGMYNVANLIVQVGLNPLGTVVVASWSMTGKIDGVYWAVSNAFGMAVTSFVGQNFGALRNDRIRKSTRIGMAVALGITASLVTAILLLGQFGLHIMIDDPEVMDCTRNMLWYLVPYYFLWSGIEVLSSTLRGIGDTVIPVAITAVGICAVRVLWVFTVFRMFPTVRSISCCYPVSWGLTLVIMSGYYLLRRRRGMLSDDTARIA